MRQSKNFIIIIALGLAVSSSCTVDPCQSKKSFLAAHEDLVEKTIDQKEGLTEEEWKQTDEKLEKLMEECYEQWQDDLTSKEKKELWKGTIQYLSTRVTSNIQPPIEEMTEAINDWLNEVNTSEFSNTVEELDKYFDGDFKDVLKDRFDDEFKDKMKESIENIGNEMKEMMQEIKEALEKKD